MLHKGIMTNQTSPSWLPRLLIFDDFHGDWSRYLDAIYACFKIDFMDSKPNYRGTLLSIKRQPVTDGKESTFWHIISEGDDEENRNPDLRRCERIRWPRPIIDNSTEPTIKVWENERQGERRICLWLEENEYLVILAKRTGYILFWTAYPVTQPHRKHKLQKEYEGFKKAGAAL
jgi:hypothetical protein